MTRLRTDLPWITNALRRNIHKRDKLYNKVKSSKGQQNYQQLEGKLIKFKSLIQNEIRKSYWGYLESVIFNDDSENCKNKRLYTHIKHNRTENSGISPLKSVGLTYTEPTQQVTLLNNQFESVFSKPKALSLKVIAELEIWFQGLNPKNKLQMSVIEISLNETDTLLNNLNPNKASGPDQISPRLLRELHTMKLLEF